MTTAEQKPLPVDLASLRTHYFPPEPDSAVSRWRAALGRLDDLIATTVDDLAELDRRDRDQVADLAQAALDAAPLESIVERLAPGDRPIREWRLAQLRQARTLATYRQGEAERTDPDYTRWKVACAALVNEWQAIQQNETEEHRFSSLVEFAGRHTPE